MMSEKSTDESNAADANVHALDADAESEDSKDASPESPASSSDCLLPGSDSLKILYCKYHDYQAREEQNPNVNSFGIGGEATSEALSSHVQYTAQVQTVMTATSQPDSRDYEFPATQYPLDTNDKNGNMTVPRSEKSESKDLNSNETVTWYRHKEDAGSSTLKILPEDAGSVSTLKQLAEDAGSISTLLVVHVNEIKPTLDSDLEELHRRLKYHVELEEAKAAEAEGRAAGEDVTEQQFHLAWKMSQMYAHNKKTLVDTTIPQEGTTDTTVKVTLGKRIRRMLKTSCSCVSRRSLEPSQL